MTCIAIVDDDVSCAQFMADALELQGWQALTYYRADGTYSLLREVQPDLVLLDVYLEQRDSGWRLLELLQLDPLTCSIPVVVCTADTSQLREREAWLQERKISILSKPFELDALYATVDAALAGRAQVPTPY